MKTSRKPSLIRWSGPASVLGAVVLVAQITLSSVLGPDQGTSNPYDIFSPFLYVTYNLLFDAALLLFVVGLVGLHARQTMRSSRLVQAGLYFAYGAGALIAASVVATLLVGLLPRLSVPLVFFTHLLTVLCLILGFLGLAGVRGSSREDAMFGTQWRWALLILAAGLGSALLSDGLGIVMNAVILGMKGTHLLHVLLTIPVAAWTARRVGVAPVMYGSLVGLISGIANQFQNHAINGTLTLQEVTVIMSVSLLAGYLGGLIARATLVDQETLLRASQAISSASDSQAVVDAIGEHLADVHVSHVALWRDVSGVEDVEISLLNVWMPPVAHVWGPGVWRPGLRLDATRVPALKNLRKGSPLVLRVTNLPAPERAAWEHQGIRSAILLPLVASSGARVGVLMVASHRTNGFPRNKARSYLTIGTQVALALENGRLVEQAQQAGVLGERQRLSHEIHDTLAQSFTSIVMNLEAAEGSLPTDLGMVQEYLDQARRIARDSLTEARRLMWALRPESLERAPLPEALARLAERWSEECGASADTAVTGMPHSLSPEVEVTLLRVAQEALTNCRKHARASRVVLTLSYMKNLVTLDVQDDGIGFDPNRPAVEMDANSTGGFGLTGMRERIQQLRGTLLVESAPGEGSTLMVAIPVAATGRGAAKAVAQTDSS